MVDDCVHFAEKILRERDAYVQGCLSKYAVECKNSELAPMAESMLRNVKSIMEVSFMSGVACCLCSHDQHELSSRGGTGQMKAALAKALLDEKNNVLQ